MQNFLRAVGGLTWAIVLMLAAGALVTAITLAWRWVAVAG